MSRSASGAKAAGRSGTLALFAQSGALWLVLMLSVAALARGQEPRLRPTPSLYDRLSPSVVSITVSGRDGAPLASGSGVILSSDGVILTNYHVVEGGVFFDIKLPGQGVDERPIPARPFQCAAGQHLATLQIVPVNGLKPVRLAKKVPAVGDHVFAVGSPLGLEGSLSDGIVSQIREDKGEVLIQTTAPISHGSSGGGLFLGDGSLVGITALSIRAGQGLNFAVSAEEISKLVPCTEFRALPPPAETSAQENPEAVATPTPLDPCPSLERFSKAIGEFWGENDLGNVEFLDAVKRRRSGDPMPDANDHEVRALLCIQVLVEDERSGQYDAIPSQLRGPVFRATGDLATQYEQMVSAFRTAHLQGRSAPAMQQASDATGETMRLLQTLASALLSLQHGAATACPGFNPFKYVPQGS